MDGTDFRILEPSPFNRVWYSHKFRGPAVKYEVGICIQTGHIVWISGPFPGSAHDLTIFRSDLKTKLGPGERVEADNGYSGDAATSAPNDHSDNLDWKRQKSNVHARHETVNGLFKNWGVLKQIFRHNLNFHSDCFSAIACVTQLELEFGTHLKTVDYDVLEDRV